MENLDVRKPQNVKSWNANTVDKRLGFAMRDSSSTRLTAGITPMPRLGDILPRYASRSNPSVAAQFATQLAVWPAHTWHQYSLPGIVAYDIEHVFANTDAFSSGDISSIFRSKKMEMRIFNNMVKYFQGIDIQLIYCGKMEIYAHIAAIRRLFKVMRHMVGSPQNRFNEAKRMLAALGFSLTEDQISETYTSWVNFFNRNITGKLRPIRWLDGMVPGEHRWEGLYEEVYKDSPAKTDFAQLFVLRPKYINIFTDVYDNAAQAYVWSFTKKPIYWFDYSDGERPANMVECFWNYLRNVATLIQNLFYDDSAADIIATVNGIQERKLSTRVAAEFMNLPDIDPFITNTDAEEFPLTYDWNMILAIHNATVLPDVEVRAPYQDPSSDELRQIIKLGDYDMTTYKPPAAVLISALPKVVNLPNFGATPEQLINATQWTVTTPGYTNLSAAERTLSADDCGTDIITRATEVKLTIMNDGATPEEREAIEMLSLNDFFVYDISRLWDGTAESAQEAYYHLTALADMNNFGLALPIRYLVQRPASGEYTNIPVVIRVDAPLEVTYIADAKSMHDIHQTFIYNFWGYPTEPESTGSFSLEKEDARDV